MISRVVLSHPDGLSNWGRFQIRQKHFRAWLTRSHESFTEGERFEEFVDTGCCGSAHHVQFVVEGVEGDGDVTRETEVEYVTRPGCDSGGGWGAQSEAGPQRSG